MLCCTSPGPHLPGLIMSCHRRNSTHAKSTICTMNSVDAGAKYEYLPASYLRPDQPHSECCCVEAGRAPDKSATRDQPTFGRQCHQQQSIDRKSRPVTLLLSLLDKPTKLSRMLRKHFPPMPSWQHTAKICASALLHCCFSSCMVVRILPASKRTRASVQPGRPRRCGRTGPPQGCLQSGVAAQALCR